VRQSSNRIGERKARHERHFTDPGNAGRHSV
jgi:hypothetical protein